ncbi:MAG: HAD family hydrolase [Gemmatimonadetes bacterium]|nr:HAD family hydrolase [Gemmatimonadota bacterium]
MTDHPPAVFLDRDGTLIEDPGHLADPAGVVLLPGVIDALHELTRLGYLRIIVTNQSGIGQGFFTEADFEAVQAELQRQLSAHGITIDAVYHCPHRREDDCDCRKPGTAMHRQAAQRFGIDLARSWCIGDRPGDLLPARALGAQAVLVRTGDGARHVEETGTLGFPVAADLRAAVALLTSAR